jgi:biopolymer transport protein ExbB
MHLVERTKDFMVWSGAQWVLWLLVAMSLASLAIIVERWLVLRSLRGGIDGLRADLIRALRAGGFAAARERVARHRHPGARVLLRGMAADERDTTYKGAEDRMAAETVAQRSKLERGFSFLATLGANAPFIGLFGTVVGILQAFDELGKTSGVVQSTAALAPQAVMSSIAEALVATAVGLAVAIPAVFAFNLFQRKVKSAFDDVGALGLEVLSHLAGGDAPRSDRDLQDKPRRSVVPSTKSPLSLSRVSTHTA